MSFVGLRVPHETARLLSEIQVPGKPEPAAHYHITLLFLGSDVPIKTIQQALLATYEVTSKTRPFTVRTSTLTSFPGGDDGTPIICRVDSDPLHALQAELRSSYDKHEVEYSKRFPEYKPHVTLSYADEAVNEARIPTVEWGAHELILWGGDSGDRRLIITFPFTLDTTHEIVDRVARRYTDESFRARLRLALPE